MTTQFMRKSACETLEIDNEFMIMDLERYTITRLNRLGGACWHMLSEPQTMESVIARLCRQYEVPSPSIEEDTEQFMNSLLECGLIERINA